MRAIDYWVGIPLVFLLTVVYRLQRLIGLATSPVGRPRNILFIQLAEMGTMVVAYPSLTKARELYPDATLHFLCFTQIRPSVEILDIIPSENIITIDAHSGPALVRDTLVFLWRARRLRIDTVINMEAFVQVQQPAELFVWRLPARRVSPVQPGRAVRRRPADAQGALQRAHPCRAHVPRSRARSRCAAGPGATRETAEGHGQPGSSEDQDRRARGRRRLAEAPRDPCRRRTDLQAGGSQSKRQRQVPHAPLPLESFTELARNLLEDPEVFVLIIGVASEKPEAQAMCARLGSPRALDLTGQTTMTELLHLFDLAHVLVTNDSGPAHFAALTRIHVIVFFGPEVPERYRPLTTSSDVIHTGYSCSPCIGPFNQRQSPCNDNLCLKSISIEEIATLVRSRLEEVRVPAAPVGGAH